MEHTEFIRRLDDHKRLLSDLMAAARLHLLAQGIDLEQLERSWHSVDLDEEALLREHRIVVRVWLHDERAPRALTKTFEIPFDAVAVDLGEVVQHG